MLVGSAISVSALRAAPSQAASVGGRRCHAAYTLMVRGLLRPCRLGAFALAWLAGCGPSGEQGIEIARARNAVALGRQDWARIYYAEDLRRHPERLESLRGVGIGWISGREGSLSRGIESLERYLELQPEDDQIRFELAEARHRRGEVEAALAALEGVTESSLSRLLRSQILLDLDPERAQVEVEAAAQESPGSFAVELQSAKVEQRLGNLRGAAAHAQRAIELEPLRHEAYVLGANLQRRLGDDSAAARALELYRITHELSSVGGRPRRSPRRQLELLRELIGHLTTVPPAVRQRLVVELVAAGEWGEAEGEVQALVGDPAVTSDDLAQLGSVLRDRGRSDLAAGVYSRVLELRPDHLGALTQLAWISLERGDDPAAEAYLERGFGVDPDHGPFHFALARLHQQAGRAGEGEAALRRAVDLVPWLAAYRIALVDALLAKGDRSGALDVLDEAPAQDPLVVRHRQRLRG